MKKLHVIMVLSGVIGIGGSAVAGGELSESARAAKNRAKMTTETAQMLAHYADLKRGLDNLEMKAALDAQAALDARAAKVQAVRPVQDKYGDPMYTWYGPLVPEPGTPEYNGPAYGASFARGYVQPVAGGSYRGYVNGAFSNTRFISHTDITLGTAASNMYMQSGMQVAPGSMAPSAARAMINNP